MARLLWVVVGFILAALVIQPAPVAIARGDLPAPRVHTEQLPQPAQPGEDPGRAPVPVPTMEPVVNPETAIGPLGLAGAVQCWNCAPFKQTIKLSHYDPMAGPINCWDYDEELAYCFSPTRPGIHWKALYGLGAACDERWIWGTWVAVPGVGAFICTDTGGAIVCDEETGICPVDILGPSGPWDGQIVEATLWVPLDPPRGEQ